MALFPSLPETPHLSDVFKVFPKGLSPLLHLHDAFLREDSELSVAERELIAAFVSGLNQCEFCAASHDLIARSYGIKEEVLVALHDDLERAPVDDKFKSILAYVKKLTEVPIKLVSKDAQAVNDAGWSEAALYDAVVVCALFNFMNRVVEGTGVIPGQDYFNVSDEALRERRKYTYTEWAQGAGLI